MVSSRSTKKDHNSVSRFLGKHKILISVIVLLLLILLFDLSPFGGNIRFYAKWAECGQKPISSDVSWYFEPSIPSYVTSPTFSLMRMSPVYFCTPLEAEQADYSANPTEYYFPHLKQKQ